MGWKTINGRRVLLPLRTRRREGENVLSRRRGDGRLLALLDRVTSRKREQERDAARAERQRADAEDRDIAEWFARVETVADAAMIAAGFHKHKRSQWRRRRYGGRTEGD